MRALVSAASADWRTFPDRPCARIDENMRILMADTLAHSAGVLENDQIPLTEKREYNRHLAYCRLSEDIPLDLTAATQSTALFSVQEYHGFRYVYVEYSYTFSMYHALAVFFRTWSEYFSFCESGRSFSKTVQRQLRECMEQLQKQNGLLSDSPFEAETMFQAVMLLDRTLTENMAEKPVRCDPEALLRRGCQFAEKSRIFDCALHLIESSRRVPQYLLLPPELFLLLVMTALFLLNAASQDRCIRLGAGEGAEISGVFLETVCGKIPKYLRHTSDLQLLQLVVPQLRHMVHLVEYLCGLSGFSAEIYAEKASGRLRIFFRCENDFDRFASDFKSPAYAEQRTAIACSCAERYLYLLCAEK